ncbi:protein LEG1 homolog [Genypterus blacodes]|uniref:protein LEG1 homolog n=1 Tax=Genypterus blacodes TaxID=154954 RepID=UPI003F76C168
MLRPSALCLLLACAASLATAAVVLENGTPILWAQTVDQLTGLPIQDGGVVSPNPWDYLHRMSLYRLLISATNPYMGSMGTDATANPVWGLTVQLGWFLTSGRFADPTGTTTCGLQTGDPMCISTESFSGCITYFVSVMSFLSATKQGLLGEGFQVQMQVPAGVTDYCATYDDCSTRHPDAMTKWDAFYQGLKDSAASPLPEEDKKDIILGLYWAAQTASMQASPVCNAKLSSYSGPETTFIKSWLSSAEYAAAAHTHFTLKKAGMIAAPLPGRVLREGDQAPNIADLSAEENHSVSVFSWMANINTLMGGLVPRTWRTVMCSVSNRQRGSAMMESLMLDPTFATSKFLTIIYGMTTGC